VGAETILKDTCVIAHHNSLVVQPFIVGTTNTPATTTIGTRIVGGDTAGLGPFNQAAGAPALPYGQSVSFHP
jgi:hypothetical protein